jgi:hypothetical protein
MKKRQLFLLLLAAAFFSCATADRGAGGLSLLDALDQGAVEIVQNLPPKTRIAVVEFKSSSPKLSDYIMEELSASLFDKGIDVCERKNLPYIQKELNLQYSSNFDEETMQSIGHFWGAQSLVTGERTFSIRTSRVYSV